MSQVFTQEEEDFFREFEFGLARKSAEEQEQQDALLLSSTVEGRLVEGENEAVPLLQPDHPLLERFQKALKEHLVKQIERFKEELGEMETGAKKQNGMREQLGIEAYEKQQLVYRQQQEIDECVKELETISAAKEELESELNVKNEEYKMESDKLHEMERQEVAVTKEVESQNLLIHQMSKWESELESTLTINQRIAEKTRKDKLRLADEKKRQDFLIYRLMSEVWRLEGELETMLMQLRVREEERERLAESVMLSNVDIEASEAENKCLTQGWQSVIATIASRDRRHTQLLAEYAKRSETLAAVRCESLQVKKMANKELVRNETLMLFKDRITKDIKVANRMLDVEVERRSRCERDMARYDAVLSRLDDGLARNRIEMQRLELYLKDIARSWDRSNMERNRIEEDIYTVLQNNVTNNKASAHLKKLAGEVKEANRGLKIILANIENSIGRTSKDILQQQCSNKEVSRVLEEVFKQVESEDGIHMAAIRDREKCEGDLEKKMRLFEVLKKRFDRIAEETNNVNLTPQEMKIENLKEQIEEMAERCREMQTFWLREQAIVVDLSEKRQSQIRDMNLLKKQITILDQKNLKINDELEHYDREELAMNRSVSHLTNRLAAYTEMLGKRRDAKETLDSDNSFTQTELSLRLEETEMQTLGLKQEIIDIEEDKETLAKELIEKNGEALQWEKKIQMVVEAKKTMAEERSGDGEVGKMRAEIHRMSVRYGQLRKVQERLITDLEHCVSRREAIVNVSDARTKLIKGGTQQVRLHFQKKLDDLNNKLQQIDNEQVHIDEQMSEKAEVLASLRADIEALDSEIDEMKERYRVTVENIERKREDKQLTLDVLVFKQKKLKVYAELARGRIPYTQYKTAAAANAAYDREKQTNGKLVTVVDNLAGDFPDHSALLGRLKNVLLLPILSL